MSNKAIFFAVTLALGILVLSGFISTAAFGASAGPTLSKVPVHITYKPASVGNGQKLTLTFMNKGTITYTFNKRCITYSTTSGGKTTTTTKCSNDSSSFAPGSKSETTTFQCVSGQHYTGYQIVWAENTAKGYESYQSNKLSFHCG